MAEHPPAWTNKDYKDPELLLDSLWQFPDGDRKGLTDWHGCNVPAIPRQLIRRFTQPGDWVFDPFCGSGTTLVEAASLGRNSIGVDLNPKAAEACTAGLTARGVKANQQGCPKAVVFTADARNFPAGDHNFALAFVHPPYWDAVSFGPDQRCLSNQVNLPTFLSGFMSIVGSAYAALKPGGHLALLIGDLYHDGEWLPLSHMCWSAVTHCSMGNLDNPLPKPRLRGIIVKDIQKNRAKRGQDNLWRSRALKAGTFVFRHEYLYVWQRPHEKKRGKK